MTQTTTQAVRRGALWSIPTEFEFVQDGAVHFLVRVLAQLAQKPKGTDAPAASPAPRSNPFLPHDPALYVGDASRTHVCLLNKFNVVPHHLLIVTRQFEPQQAPLNLADFTALWQCLAEYEGLGFYNAGPLAGASQPHKHLQLVPLPLAPRGPAVPLQPLIRASPDGPGVGRSPGLPFRHALARWEPSWVENPAQAAEVTVSLYQQMMQSLGLRTDAPRTGAYNLLVTRQWMLLVPRRHEMFASISLNALAFAGALLVRDGQQLEQLRQRGPMAALVHAAGEPDDASPP